jgi:hypothetical protein
MYLEVEHFNDVDVEELKRVEKTEINCGERDAIRGWDEHHSLQK